MCVYVCSVGRQCANESFSVILWLKVHHFSSQDNSLANVNTCMSVFYVG